MAKKGRSKQTKNRVCEKERKEEIKEKNKKEKKKRIRDSVLGNWNMRLMRAGDKERFSRSLRIVNMRFSPEIFFFFFFPV